MRSVGWSCLAVLWYCSVIPAPNCWLGWLAWMILIRSLPTARAILFQANCKLSTPQCLKKKEIWSKSLSFFEKQGVSFAGWTMTTWHESSESKKQGKKNPQCSELLGLAVAQLMPRCSDSLVVTRPSVRALSSSGEFVSQLCWVCRCFHNGGKPRCVKNQ